MAIRLFSRAVAVNIAFSCITAIGAALVTRFSTALFAPAALALFFAARRYSASVSAIANLGGPFFQIRYMAMHADDLDLGDLIALMVTGTYAVVIVVLLVITGMVTWSGGPAMGYPAWFWWRVAFLAAAQLLVFSVYGSMLVRQQLIRYNGVKFLAATGLLFPALWATHNGSACTAIDWYLAMTAVLLLVAHGHQTGSAILRLRRLPTQRLRWLAREAWSYGPPRAAVNFLDSLLFVVPVWLIRDAVKEEAFLLTMFALLQAAGVVVLPVNELAMVAGARAVGAEGDARERLHQQTSSLASTLALVACAVVAVLWPFRSTAFQLLISGQEVRAGVATYSTLIACVIPITIFNGLKGVVDVYWVRPRNLLNLVCSHLLGVGSFGIARALGASAHASVLTACLVTMWLLGGLTLAAIRELLTRIAWKRLGWGLSFVLVVCAGELWLAEVGHDARLIVRFAVLLVSGAVAVGGALVIGNDVAVRQAIARLRRVAHVEAE